MAFNFGPLARGIRRIVSKVAVELVVLTIVGIVSVVWNNQKDGAPLRRIQTFVGLRPPVPSRFPCAVICGDTRPEYPAYRYVYRLSGWENEKWVLYGYGNDFVRFDWNGTVVFLDDDTKQATPQYHAGCNTLQEKIMPATTIDWLREHSLVLN